VKKLFLILLSSLLLPSVCFGADMYFTTTGAGDHSASSWSNSGSMSVFENDIINNSESDDRYFVEGSGTYTATQNISVNSTSVSIIGVTSGTTAEPPTTSDYAYGSDRPTLAMGANSWTGASSNIARNLIITTTATAGFNQNNSSIFDNCKSTNSSGTAGRYAFYSSSTFCKYIDNEIISTNGYAIRMQADTRLVGNYIHDSSYGPRYNGGSMFISNVFDTITNRGIDQPGSGAIIMNNVFYNCGTAIHGWTSQSLITMNNIFDNNTIGANSYTNYSTAVYDYNIWSNNTTDVSNITKGDNSVTSDITFTDAPNGDFTLPDSSVAEGVGAPIGSNMGLTGDYNWNIGVDQTDTQSGGGGGSVTVGYGFTQ